MEPGLIDRDHLPDVANMVDVSSPQWSPVLSTGITRPRRPPSTSRSIGRNGARSYRPGSPHGWIEAQEIPASRNGARSYRPGSPGRGRICGSALGTPQWSPVLSTGITPSSGRAAGGCTCRNGARSYRPGSRRAARPPRRSRRGRNGARSYRPGSPGDVRGRDAAQLAAMEPGLIDRDHMNRDVAARPRGPPQWSPVLSTGITSSPPGHAQSSWRPQWSPVLSTGITRASGPIPVPGSGAAMEPGLIDRDHRPGVAMIWRARMPQWSPVLSTGITCEPRGIHPSTR